ncbi:alpha/beta hydrolase family protein [Anaerolentibacter hominis]|uniref:alpha/beta hydrolase family protein n=1 Tax=Anaerolentibacter hominis TaxID=3079009 RepID=UPI0031B8A32C
MEGNDTYYTSITALKARFDETEKSCAFRASGPEEYQRWKKETRETLAALLGLAKMKMPQAPVRITKTEQLQDYERIHLIIPVEPGIGMPCFFLKPNRPRCSPCPVIIATHGHGSGGKLAVAGLDMGNKKLRENRMNFNYAYGEHLATQGYMVFCPDARGFGERREAGQQGEDSLLSSSCRELNQVAISMGMSLLGMFIWDLMRLLDYICTREDCDTGRIACVGFSGGGAQSLWLTALDDRVRAGVVSGYCYGVGDSLLLMNDNCSCNYVPGLWEHADMGDVGALIAPRPLLIETGDSDPLNGHRGVINALEQTDVIKSAYRLLRAQDQFRHEVCRGGHRFYGDSLDDFLERALG